VNVAGETPMRVGLLIACVSLLGLAGCGGTNPNTCGNKVCTATQRCDTATKLCVQDVGPTLTLDDVTGVATGSTQTVTGTAKDDVQVASVEWSADNGATWTAATLDGTAFSIDVPLPALDAKPLTVSARAKDSLGQTASALSAANNVPPADSALPNEAAAANPRPAQMFTRPPKAAESAPSTPAQTPATRVNPTVAITCHRSTVRMGLLSVRSLAFMIPAASKGAKV